MAAGGRVSIPAGARRTVADIKEIAGGHTDEEVYAMLRDCNMDPNETAQRLLLQDTFHEVKRKRDKKKEGSKEPSDSRWRPAVQGRGVKNGRGNYSSRNLANSGDSAGRIAISGKENGMNQTMETSSGSTQAINMDMDHKDSTSMPSSSQPVDAAAAAVKKSSAIGGMIKFGSTASVGLKGGVPLEGVVTAVGQVIGSQKTFVELMVGCDVATDNKGSSQQSVSSSFGQSSGSRPSSSYSSRSHQSYGSQKAPNKEWKPKPTSNTVSQATKNVLIPDDVPLVDDTVPQSAPISNSVNKEDPLKVDRSFSDLQLSDKLHVIIPDHLQVSESEKYGLSFGSFNTSFHQTGGSSDLECAKRSSQAEYNSSQELNDIDDEPKATQRYYNSPSTVLEETDKICQQLPSANQENCSPSAVQISSTSPAELDEHRDDSATLGAPHNSATSGVPQFAAIHTAPSYLAYGLAPQSHGNQIAVVENSESQAQQPIDFSASYCSQSYQPATDTNEQLSSFIAAGAVLKFENIPAVPAQIGQDQEENNSPVLASSVSASITIPTAAVMPASVAIPQQSIPVFRQSLGVHLPPFPANYVPYNQYISPFFIPPPGLHPFLGSATFPQPSSTGAMYPAPGSAVLPPIKYSFPSYKPGANTGSQASVGIPGGYGTYGSSPSVYTNNTTVSSGNPADNDDVALTQFKENSIYIAGHQTEGSTLWVPTPGRDISALQTNSFYGLPPQGQQVAFAPQAGHGPFGGMYHPAHTVAGAAVHPLLQPSHNMAGTVEIVGAPGVYQQPQAPMNWGSY